MSKHSIISSLPTMCRKKEIAMRLTNLRIRRGLREIPGTLNILIEGMVIASNAAGLEAITSGKAMSTLNAYVRLSGGKRVNWR